MRTRLATSALALALAACTSGGGAHPSPSAAPVTLPPGTLKEKVLQPDEVAAAMAPIAAQTGERDATAIAAFSADPAAAKTSLDRHGFQVAYVVQYGDPATSAVITNVVSQFATEAGATADLTADLRAAGGTGTAFDVTGLGDQAGGVRGTFSASAAPSTLVTLRWRVGNTTWLLAVGAPKPVDEAGVRGLADRLMQRLATSD